VDQLESVQATLVVLQGIPMAVEPLVDKLITLNECHAELASATIQLNDVIKPLIKEEAESMARRLKQARSDWKSDWKEAMREWDKRIYKFFHGVNGLLLPQIK
jgi:hypothetical protein